MDHSFTDVMGRLRAGDDAAAAEVFSRFANRLIALARSRLDQILKAKVDPEDVMQSVYRSFFRRQAETAYELAGWDGLWGLLTVITLRKCGHRADYFHAACRDVRREAIAGTNGDHGIISRDPTPSHAARLAETVEQVMSLLSERERNIFTLSLQGHDGAAISAQVGRTERTVQRVLKRVREHLEHLHADAGADR